jgi:hypothetical protein
MRVDRRPTSFAHCNAGVDTASTHSIISSDDDVGFDGLVTCSSGLHGKEPVDNFALPQSSPVCYFCEPPIGG